MSWLSAILLPVLIYLLWITYALYKNYVKACTLNVPVIISPIAPNNPLWIFIYQYLKPYLKSSPLDIIGFTRYIYYGWAYDDKYRTHEKLGPAFVVVNPSTVELYIANGEAIDSIFTRAKDFPKPVALYKPVEIYGQNVATVVGADWQRHRKMTAPSFNERNSGLVWNGAIRQARNMLTEWSLCNKNGTTSTINGTITLALYVLTSVGFGISYSFKPGSSSLSPGHTLAYRDALAGLTNNIIPLFIFPYGFVTLPYMPANVRRIGTYFTEFKAYMTEMVARERELIDEREPGTGNLISSLVRASDQANGYALTESEIFGNIFFYSLAGHESTANTIAFAIHLLAVYPSYQDWLHSEITHVLSSQETPNYETSYPRLKRCLATMNETLRLWGPIANHPKWTDRTPQLLTIAGKEHLIPADVYVNINQTAVHTLPKYWGNDSLQWLPDRWIAPSPSTSNSTTTFDSEVLKDPPGGKGTFIPFADGARGCVGKRFSQVEFVAVLATLFREHKVRPKVLDGESMEEARKRVWEYVLDVEPKITFQLKKSTAAGFRLVWERR